MGLRGRRSFPRPSLHLAHPPHRYLPCRMPRYVAFLRGINVGGHRVKMDRLKALFGELDLADVATFVRSLSELQDVAACRPFTEAETAGPDHSLYVVFMERPPDQDVRADIADLGTDMDELRVHGREIYWLVRGKLTESTVFAGGLTKATKKAPTTTRNVKTLRRIMAKYVPGEGGLGTSA